MASAALIFPVYAKKEKHWEVVEKCYTETKERSNGMTLYVMDDGCFWPDMVSFFSSENKAGHCKYFGLEPHSGLTRSWNEGAREAVEDDHEVLIFGNQDAYPNTQEDVDKLIEHTEALKGAVFALGPVTNSPGHVIDQFAREPKDKKEGVMALCHLNGFTWSVHKNNYLGVLTKRGFFLNDDPRKKLAVPNVVDWEGPREQSLSQIGQEDELFQWVNYHLNAHCAVCFDSFWWHEKKFSSSGYEK
jgi:hypothetical protein